MTATVGARTDALGRGSQGRRERRSRVPHLEDGLVLVAVALSLAIALLARHFPYGDMPNHLARYALMDRYWSGVATPGIEVHLTPSPYVLVDLIGVGLLHLFGAKATERILVALVLVILPAGVYLLIRATAPERRGWALVAALFAFNWFLTQGMYNYSLGIGLAFVWLAWWWPRRAATSWRGRALLGAGAVCLFFVHLAAPLIALVVVWVTCLVDLLSGSPESDRARRVRVELITAVTITAMLGALWVIDGLPGGVAGSAAVVKWRSLEWKILALGAVFYSFSLDQAAVMAGAYVVCVLAFVLANRGALRAEAMVWSAGVFLLLFAISPLAIGASGALDTRWLIPAYLLPFCMSGSPPVRRQRPYLILAFAAYLAQAGAMWLHTKAIDRRLDDFDAVLHEVPPKTAVLPIVADGKIRPRVDEYYQYAFWHVVRREGRVPGLWSLNAPREGDPPSTHLRYFVAERMYLPPVGWGTENFGPLDWSRISAEYDYIVLAGDDPRARAYLGAHAKEVLHVGAMTLYKVPTARALVRDRG